MESEKTKMVATQGLICLPPQSPACSNENVGKACPFMTAEDVQIAELCETFAPLVHFLSILCFSSGTINSRARPMIKADYES